MGHEVFHTSQDVQIYYTGIELRADDDELVWQQVLEYAKHFPLGQPVSFTLYQLCTDLDWPINGRYYQRAEECLDRLQASAIKFISKRLGSLESLSMIKRYRMVGRGSRGARCEVEIELASHRERLGEGLDAQLSAVGADEADLTGTNAVVVPVFWLLRRCYG